MAGFLDINTFSFRGAEDVIIVGKKVVKAKEDALQELKTIIASPNPANEDIIQTDDEFLMKFLNARKMNVEESYQLLCRYYSYRKKNKELFENLSTNDALIKQALYDGFPSVLPKKDRKGRTILLFFCNNWDQANYPLEVIYRSLILTLEKLIIEVPTQLNGFVVVVDWTDMTFRQATNLTPKTIRQMIEGLQDCFPARFKAIHFINQPWFIDSVFSILKAFLKEKTKNKILSHGNNLSTLHNHIPVDILPTELGGEGPPFSPTLWADTLNKP